jgi:hypothetical protein
LTLCLLTLYVGTGPKYQGSICNKSFSPRPPPSPPSKHSLFFCLIMCLICFLLTIAVCLRSAVCCLVSLLSSCFNLLTLYAGIKPKYQGSICNKSPPPAPRPL